MRLSSSMTFLWKFVFPGIWLVGICTGVVEVGKGTVTGLKAIGGFGFFALAFLFTIWMVGAIKSVWLEGDRLIISNFLKKAVIPLEQVAVVNDPDLTSGRRIEISFISPTIFGEEIVFVPRFLQAKSTAKMLQNRVEDIEKRRKMAKASHVAV